MLVGDVDAFGPALEAAGLGRIAIERDEVAGEAGPIAEAPGPLDQDSETGPTAGAEEPEVPVVADEPADGIEDDPGG